MSDVYLSINLLDSATYYLTSSVPTKSFQPHITKYCGQILDCSVLQPHLLLDLSLTFKLKSKRKIFHPRTAQPHLLLSEVSDPCHKYIKQKRKVKIHRKSMISCESFRQFGVKSEVENEGKSIPEKYL